MFEIVTIIIFKNIFCSEMYENNIFFLKKLFLTSTHQNDLKIPKNINLKQIKKFKNFQFFSKTFLKYKNKYALKFKPFDIVEG